MATTRKEAAYHFILSRILDGEYKPGSRLSEEHIAKAAGISATPVREAYRQLSSEGLIEHIPNRGVFVRTVSDDEVDALYETRELLETFAAGKAAHLISRRELETMRQSVETQHDLCRKLRDSGEPLLKGGDITQWLEADVGFHMILLKASGNPVILKMVRQCHIISNLLGSFRHLLTLGQIARTWLHHARILRALRLRDPERAATCMRTHIRFSFQTAMDASAGSAETGGILPPGSREIVEKLEQSGD
jgi:GntR family transcriptional regulator of vanillate catabolism